MELRRGYTKMYAQIEATLEEDGYVGITVDSISADDLAHYLFETQQVAGLLNAFVSSGLVTNGRTRVTYKRGDTPFAVTIEEREGISDIRKYIQFDPLNSGRGRESMEALSRLEQSLKQWMIKRGVQTVQLSSQHPV